MNKLFQYSKIVSLGVFFSFLLSSSLLSSCSKEDPTEERSMCDNITLTVNNLLSNDLEDIIIGGQNFGTVASGQTEILCLDQSGAYDPNPTQLMLFMQATYQGDVISDGYFCGTGLISVDSGSFEMDITEVNDNFLVYSFK